MRRRRGCLGVVLGLGLVAGACTSGHKPAAAPTTTVAPDPYAIPAVITPAYVNSVFVALNRIEGDVTRELVAHSAVTAQALRDIRAVYNDPLYKQEVTIAHQSLAYISNAKHPPGDVMTSVVKLLTATATCIFVSTRSDFSAVDLKPVQTPASEYWVLSPKQSNDDELHLNPTPWALSFNASYLTTTEIPNQCPH